MHNLIIAFYTITVLLGLWNTKGLHCSTRYALVEYTVQLDAICNYILLAKVPCQTQFMTSGG